MAFWHGLIYLFDYLGFDIKLGHRMVLGFYDEVEGLVNALPQILLEDFNEPTAKH